MPIPQATPATSPRLGRLWLVASLAASMLACDAATPLQPRATTEPRPATVTTDSVPPGGSFTIPVPANNQSPTYGEVDPLPTGITIPEGWFARIRIPASGVVTYSYSNMCNNTNDPLDHYTMTAGPNGVPDQLWGQFIQVGWSVVYGPNPYDYTRAYGNFQQQQDSSWVTLAYTVNGAHELRLGRTGVKSDCENFDGPYDYVLSGTQAAAIDFVTLRFEIAKNPILAGDSAAVTLRPVNMDTAGMFPNSWYFYPVTGGYVALTECEGAWTCKFNPTASGRIAARANAYGTTMSVDDSLKLLPCPIRDSTADTLLNNYSFRQELQGVLKLSMRDSTGTLLPDSARREHIGLMIQDTSTGAVSYRLAPMTASTPCSFDGLMPSISPPQKLVALYHTHPFDPGGRWGGADRLPANCEPGQAGQFYRSKPSDTDWANAVKRNVPYFYIDARTVGTADGSLQAAKDSTQWSKLNRRHDWNTKKCTW